MAENDKQTPMVIYGAKKASNKETYWSRIGAAFTNSDGSLNLAFDYFPTDLANTTIQVREPKKEG
jgi:hypothetical protein